MPGRSLAVVAATAAFFVGFALAVTGVVLLPNHRGLGLALMGGGLVVVLVGSWVSTLGRAAGGHDRPSRDA